MVPEQPPLDIRVDPCRRLEWDTQFWGFPVARVATDFLDDILADSVDAWCRANNTRCLYFMCRPDHLSSTRVAERRGYHLVDVRISLARHSLVPNCGTLQESTSILVRHSTPADVPALGCIARDAHQDSRFYYDPGFPRGDCDRFYVRWIEESCRGYADRVLVAEVNGIAVGYVTCHLDRDSESGRIGLVGVTPQARGKGVAQCIINRALEWFEAQGAWRLLVATQGRNVAAQRLYQRCGFVTESVALWYHKWYPEG